MQIPIAQHHRSTSLSFLYSRSARHLRHRRYTTSASEPSYAPIFPPSWREDPPPHFPDVAGLVALYHQPSALQLPAEMVCNTKPCNKVIKPNSVWPSRTPDNNALAGRPCTTALLHNVCIGCLLQDCTRPLSRPSAFLISQAHPKTKSGNYALPTLASIP